MIIEAVLSLLKSGIARSVLLNSVLNSFERSNIRFNFDSRRLGGFSTKIQSDFHHKTQYKFFAEIRAN